MVQADIDVREFIDAIDPGAVGRCSWETERTRQDLELLWWIGRFRFVTAEQIASKLGCSVQRANARARRLEQRGLVGRERAHSSQPSAVFLTGRGHELLGLPRRRPPRASVQREHEAAIVDLALQLERRLGPAALILTERQCRQHDHADEYRTPYSVRVPASGHGPQRRWPDLVLATRAGRTAVELELTPKGSSRLRGILDAYRASAYSHVVIAAQGAALHARISALADERHASELATYLGLPDCPITVVRWQAPGAASKLARILAREHASPLARSQAR